MTHDLIKLDSSMKWYHYTACFFSGVFMVNGLPHFIHGLEGDLFPTPFANPPGTGLSSPMVNMVWALVNFCLGTVLLRVGRVSFQKKWTWILLFMGIGATGLLMSYMAATVLEFYKAGKVN